MEIFANSTVPCEFKVKIDEPSSNGFRRCIPHGEIGKKSLSTTQ